MTIDITKVASWTVVIAFCSTVLWGIHTSVSQQERLLTKVAHMKDNMPSVVLINGDHLVLAVPDNQFIKIQMERID